MHITQHFHTLWSMFPYSAYITFILSCASFFPNNNKLQGLSLIIFVSAGMQLELDPVCCCYMLPSCIQCTAAQWMCDLQKGISLTALLTSCKLKTMAYFIESIHVLFVLPLFPVGFNFPQHYFVFRWVLSAYDVPKVQLDNTVQGSYSR